MAKTYRGMSKRWRDWRKTAVKNLRSEEMQYETKLTVSRGTTDICRFAISALVLTTYDFPKWQFTVSQQYLNRVPH